MDSGEVQIGVKRITERWIWPVQGGEGRKEGQGRVVKFMEGWGWPDEGEEGQGKISCCDVCQCPKEHSGI